MMTKGCLVLHATEREVAGNSEDDDGGSGDQVVAVKEEKGVSMLVRESGRRRWRWRRLAAVSSNYGSGGGGRGECVHMYWC
ncbi:hypothetical protein Syun_017473 [Stephania yunnanensis]|uniref:Uncharacterized protein n=1 Tax=Stephania yunnanensis TaxID=152371 RepID=A0AAP0J704_9MAGN